MSFLIKNWHAFLIILIFSNPVWGEVNFNWKSQSENLFGNASKSIKTFFDLQGNLVLEQASSQELKIKLSEVKLNLDFATVRLDIDESELARHFSLPLVIIKEEFHWQERVHPIVSEFFKNLYQVIQLTQELCTNSTMMQKNITQYRFGKAFSSASCEKEVQEKILSPITGEQVQNFGKIIFNKKLIKGELKNISVVKGQEMARTETNFYMPNYKTVPINSIKLDSTFDYRTALQEIDKNKNQSSPAPTPETELRKIQSALSKIDSMKERRSKFVRSFSKLVDRCPAQCNGMLNFVTADFLLNAIEVMSIKGKLPEKEILTKLEGIKDEEVFPFLSRITHYPNPSEIFIKKIFEMFESENKIIPLKLDLFIASILRKSSDSNLKSIFINKYIERPEITTYHKISLIGNLGDANFKDYLKQQIASAQDDIVAEAIYAFRFIKDEESKKLLDGLMFSPNKKIKSAVKKTLGAWEDQQ